MNFLDKKKVNADELYSVGYSPVIGEYVMEVVVTWVMWYHRYFKITKEEYDLAETSAVSLNAVAEKLRREGTGCPQFLCSDGPKENNEKQEEMLQKLREYESKEDFVRF